MRIDIQNKAELQEYFKRLAEFIQQKPQCFIKYIDLGVKVIRVISYDKDFLPHMQRQMTYVLRDNMDHYDETLVLFKEENTKQVAMSLGDKFDPKKNMRLRLDVVMNHNNYPSIWVFDEEYSHVNTVVSIDMGSGIVEGFDVEKHTCYYGVRDLDPEEFIKQGHCFVQPLNNLIKTDTVNIAHGAIIGFNNNGLLMCARGQRGKSTLTVHAMMHGFEYVSDDYQILENKNGQLLSYPIYSIITLSPTMYSELYDDLKGKFVSNNARKDKYVINIAEYHDQFRKAYPIRLCLFPEIVSDPEPSIKFCTPKEKGRAIVQLIQSTVMQMRDLNNHAVIKKMFDMVKDMDFYKFNLCRNIAGNTEYLRQFLKDFDFNVHKGIPTDKIMVDITFDLANILDSETSTIYSMNKFATNVYENLLKGVDTEEIWHKLEPMTAENENLREEFDALVQVINDHGFIQDGIDVPENFEINPEFAAECNFKLSVWEYGENKTIDLINIK